MKVTIAIRRIRVLLRSIRDGSLVPQPDFQRRLVWNNADKQRFLDTVLRGYPFPEIYVAAGSVDTVTGESTELLVDGQQRITTLFHYFYDDPTLKLGKHFPKYADLDHDEKVAFLEYEVVVRDLGSMPRDEIVKVFERINATQYSLNTMEVQHARYRGDLKNLAVEVADASLFEDYKVFSAALVRRMQDVEFALTLIVTVMSTYFNRDTEIETYLERYNEDFEAKEDVAHELEEVFTFVTACNFPKNSRMRNRSDLFTLLVEVHRAIVRQKNFQLDPVEVGERLEQFYREVNERAEETERSYPQEILEAYYQAAVQATNDRGNRIRRGEIISQIIQGVEPTQVKVESAPKAPA